METEAGGEDCGGAEPDRNAHPHSEPDTEKMAKRNTPAKTRAQKRLNSFKLKSAEWAKGMRRNRNVSHFLDDIEVTMEKMKALGLRPLLFYGVYDEKRSRYDTKVICPYSTSNETEVMLKKINMLYSVLLQAWTPEDEGRRRGEKRKGKKGNRRAVSGVERAAAPLSGEEGAVALDSGAEETVAPEGGDREPTFSVKMAKRNTPAKTRAQKRLNSFKLKSAEWAKGMRRNRNMEKMKTLGLRPLLFYGVYDEKRSRYDTKVICPYSTSNETEVMLKKINMLYSVLLQAWTPEDEGRRRGEKRKGKKGNRRAVSGVERAAAPLSGEEGAAAAAPLSGEEGAVALDSGAEETVAPEGGDREPTVSVIHQFKKAKKTTGGEAAVVDRGEESSRPVIQQLKIQVKKRRQTSRECGLHPYADAFEAWKLGQTKQKKGVDYVYVFWKSCEGCGETWRPSWEPAINIEFGT
ncbi:uncharacterized protein LOC120572041 isoform X3 [Perca fluviatilis]|uniref:uncharacterized protein LOC120572041 isoform X3 n=1 Tax=Perca fluviatilis TaxID=8168 RepID=UPI0019647047|nr:uncharacterized protein LOC120572041 isoform X3 [Perca fluviatilis]